EARDQKDRVAELVREPEVRADSGDRAVHVDRKRTVEAILMGVERALARTNQTHVLALELELEGHLKEARGARIFRMQTVAEPRRHFVLRYGLAYDRFRRLLQRPARADVREPAVEEAHARFDGAAVMWPEAEDAGRDAVL